MSDPGIYCHIWVEEESFGAVDYSLNLSLAVAPHFCNITLWAFLSENTPMKNALDRVSIPNFTDSRIGPKLRARGR